MHDAFHPLMAAERTDRGLVREDNEDALLSLPRAGLFAVADGMGGAREGEVAAQAVVDHLREASEDEALSLPARIRRCREAINEASVWIRRYASRNGNPGMGTTIVALLFDPHDPSRAAVLHAGDSRLYRLRDGVLEALTRDHSVAAMTGLGNEFQVPALFRGVITRAVGVRRHVETETNFLEVRSGDLYLLCTDGLYGLVPHEAMTRILAAGHDLDAMAVELVEAALAAGGDDNVTVVLVRPAPRAPVSDGLSPDPARPGSPPFPWRGLISLLTIGLLGLLGAWFAFTPYCAARPPGPADTPVSEAPVSEVSRAVPVVSRGMAAPPPAPDPAPPVLDAAAAWTRERDEVAAEPDRVRSRHLAVVAAFDRLANWSGVPVEAPSLMILGRPEEKPDAWVRYLDQAQARWLTACSNAVARMRAESACLTPDRLAALWNWSFAPRGETDPAPLRAAQAARDRWVEEVDRMVRYLAAETGAAPFLHRLPPDLFSPERSAAVWGDRAWSAALPWVDQVWRRHDYWTAQQRGGHGGDVDETIRLANAFWAGFKAMNYEIRPWRNSMKPEQAEALLDRLRESPAGLVAEKEPKPGEGK